MAAQVQHVLSLLFVVTDCELLLQVREWFFFPPLVLLFNLQLDMRCNAESKGLVSILSSDVSQADLKLKLLFFWGRE